MVVLYGVVGCPATRGRSHTTETTIMRHIDKTSQRICTNEIGIDSRTDVRCSCPWLTWGVLKDRRLETAYT